MTKTKKKNDTPPAEAHDAPELDRKPGLYLKHVPGKGRGVFCRTAIAEGEALEVTPGLFLDLEETEIADETRLVDYTFFTDDADSGEEAEGSNVIMGIMTFCNHGLVPNAAIEWEKSEDENNTVYFTLRATRDIPPDTEICTTYGEGWFEERLQDPANN